MMIDAATLLWCIGFFAFGIIIGRSTKKQKPRTPQTPTPICGCDHGLHDHDPKTGECHGLMDGDPLRYNEFSRPTAFKQVRCTCKQYTGPRPIDQIWIPDMLPPSSSSD